MDLQRTNCSGEIPYPDLLPMNIEQSRMMATATIRAKLLECGLTQCFSESELTRLDKTSGYRSLCARYLVKEMIIDAIGTGILMKDMSIENNEFGAPQLQLLSNEVEEYIQSKGIKEIHLSYSHSRSWIGAFLIIEYF